MYQCDVFVQNGKRIAIARLDDKILTGVADDVAPILLVHPWEQTKPEGSKLTAEGAYSDLVSSYESSLHHLQLREFKPQSFVRTLEDWEGEIGDWFTDFVKRELGAEIASGPSESYQSNELFGAF